MVMLMHGYAEHLRWYHDLGVQFADQGLLAFGHDHSKRAPPTIKVLIFLFNIIFHQLVTAKVVETG